LTATDRRRVRTRRRHGRPGPGGPRARACVASWRITHRVGPQGARAGGAVCLAFWSVPALARAPARRRACIV